MIKRASADRPADSTSFRLRATIERRLSSSALLGGSAVTRLSASNFAQHEEPRLVQYLLQKWVVRRSFPVEFRRRVDGRINFPAEQFPGASQRQCKLRRRNLSDDHEIDIAVALLASGGDGAVHKGGPQLHCERFERIRQNVHEPRRFKQ